MTTTQEIPGTDPEPGPENYRQRLIDENPDVVLTATLDRSLSSLLEFGTGLLGDDAREFAELANDVHTNTCMGKDGNYHYDWTTAVVFRETLAAVMAQLTIAIAEAEARCLNGKE